MSDEVSRILHEGLARGARSELAEPDADLAFITKEEFDEAAYLDAHADVAEAIRRGEVLSGYNHYISYGMREGRVLPGPPREPRNRVLTVPARPVASGGPTHLDARHAVELVAIAPQGGLMIVGWIDDADTPIDCIRILGPNWRVLVDGGNLIRLRRRDVEEALGAAHHAFGFFGFIHFEDAIDPSGMCTVEVWLRHEASGSTRMVSEPREMAPHRYDGVALRNVCLTYLSQASFFGNAAVEALACLDRGFGDAMLALNRAITNRVVQSPYVERFGQTGRRTKTSIIVCLYGKAEFQFLQSCLYAGLPGIEDYEFLYVSNSPELAETLLNEARSISLVYGVPQTVVILAGNAGFGGANNAAARFANSPRIIALNPDVFPYDRDWARKHTQLIAAAPVEQARLFGVPLYYDDGSLMHGGMYFETQTGLSLGSQIPKPLRIAHVEHYGKGAPHHVAGYVRPRPVPAVTGAFISVERAWFEKLGGFTEDYVFGHYEDADLCLKSIMQGTRPWLHDIKLWHLEGKGSTRLPPHEGGSTVNRWLFSKTWLPLLEAGLSGFDPTYPGFEDSAPMRPTPTSAAGAARNAKAGRKSSSTGRGAAAQ